MLDLLEKLFPFDRVSGFPVDHIEDSAVKWPVLHRDRTSSPTAAGPTEPTATAHTSAAPALGAGVQFTTGAASICNPAHRPDIEKLQRTLQRGEAGYLCEQIDLDAVAAFRDYRSRVGLLPDPAD